MITCPYCESSHIYKNGFSIKGEQRYICINCNRKFTESTVVRMPKETIVIHCINCGKETTNPRFCSKTCAAQYNNVHFPKRQANPRFCKYCGVRIHGRRTTCDECNPSIVDWTERTLKQIRDAAKYQANGQIRGIARRTYEQANRPRICANCGYSKHIEICHIRAINSFPDETPVAVINDLANLVALCPNCHWEFDNGLLRLE